MTKSKIFLWVLTLSSVSVIAYLGVRRRPAPAVAVQMATVQEKSITRTVTGAGKVQAATTVKISSNLSGDLIELRVKVGERVTKGQVLGRLDKRRFEAAAKQSQAAQSAARADVQLAQVELQRTKAEFERVLGLLNKGMASNAEVERARSERDSSVARLSSVQERVAQASAAFEEAQTALSNTTLVSPIDGSVIEVSREVGERVRGSDFSEDVVMTLASMAAMEVKIEVGEHEVIHLALGQKASVTVDALEGQVFQGEVIEIAQKALIKSPGTESEVTSFPIIVALNEKPPGVLPGMSAEVRIAASTREKTLVIPIQSVTVRPLKSLPSTAQAVDAGPTLESPESLVKVVFVVTEQQQASVRRIVTGLSSDTEMEVLQGLRPGERVVEGPYRTLAKQLNDRDRLEPWTPEASKRGARGPRS